jgi:3-oxoacyl-[acyl-carrier protein] reductase
MGNLRYDFTGRTAIVTGAARGIGLELGRMFHTAGAEVFLIDFDEEELASPDPNGGGHPS